MSSATVDERRECEKMLEPELIAACQKRNSIAFEVLVKRYERTVYSLLYQLAPDWHDVNDFVQEVFIRVWKSIQSLRNAHAFKSWLHQLVTNLFYDELRRRPRADIIYIDDTSTSEEADDFLSREIADATSMPDELNQRRELSEAIDDAIASLPEQFREVMVLRELEGLSYDQIAAFTHCEIGTVKSRIARARAKVQERLIDYAQLAS